MNAIRKYGKLALVVVVGGLVVGMLSGTASAAHKPPKVERVQVKFQASDNHSRGYQSNDRFSQRFILPGEPYPRSRQSLGFYGHIDLGYGMHVERVIWGSLAGQIGLQAGDEIVAINGRRIECERDYIEALNQACGRTTMVVRDVRGRGYVQVAFDLEEQHSQPVLYVH